jgi:hypothetical protein
MRAEQGTGEPSSGTRTDRMAEKSKADPHGAERRRFVRHVTEVPVVCRRAGQHASERDHLDDMSLGGLAFVSDERYESGDSLEVSFPSISPDQLLPCTVSWRREMKGQASPRYVYGVQFGDEGLLFRARLVNKVCDIEEYRGNQLRRWGRRISSEQAARELAATQAYGWTS